jgi:hypothetical protein
MVRKNIPFELVVLPNKRHSWRKKGILPTPKVKKIIDDGS